MSDTTRQSTGNNWAQSGSPANKGNQNTQGRVDALKDKVGDALDRGKSGIADSVHATGDSLADDMAKLRQDMATIQQTLSKFVSEAGGEAVKTAQSVGSAVASQVSEVATDMANSAKEQAKTFASEMENMARRNPLGTIGATLLVGVVIGMMSRGRA